MSVEDVTAAEATARKVIEEKGFACMRCKFFNRYQSVDLTGECRRNAPLSHDTYGKGLWPFVELSDWCGQGSKA